MVRSSTSLLIKGNGNLVSCFNFLNVNPPFLLSILKLQGLHYINSFERWWIRQDGIYVFWKT